MSLVGKKLLIIGGGSGVGKATAIEAVAAGARVIIAGRTEERLSSVKDELGEGVETCVLDIRDPRELDYCFETVDGFDALVVTAVEDYRSDFIECDLDDAKKAFETKFWGQFIAAQRSVPFISKRGSITLFSGVAGRRVVRGECVLGAANHAIEALVRFLAIELSPLRINAVASGETRVEEDEERNRAVADSLPIRRIGEHADVAAAVLYLVENQFTTGAVLRVDGGATAF